MTYVKIADQQIEAIINGKMRDSEWGNRESKSITCSITYADALSIFINNVAWSIIYQADPYIDPETNETITPDSIEYDNSDFCVAGPITDNRNGTITVKMGKYTDAELLAILEEAIR